MGHPDGYTLKTTTNFSCHRLFAILTACMIVAYSVHGTVSFAESAESEEARSLAADKATEFGLDDLHTRIAELTPDVVSGAELLSGQVRLIGCSKPKSGTVDVKAASHCYLTAYFEFMPEVRSPFDRELLVSLGKIDIGRIPIRVEHPRPGDVVKHELALYIPRNAPSGATTIRAGFVEEGSPGESRVELSLNMAPLISLDIGPSDPLPKLKPAQKRALLNGVTGSNARNLVRNGGFEQAWQHWDVDENLTTGLEGLDGWPRTLNSTFDYDVAIEGITALRIDFGGGQDPNFWHFQQDVAVRPNTDYLLSYFVKTENISSREGPSLSIHSQSESERDKLYFATAQADRLTGTHDWTYIEIPFKTGAVTTTMLLRIRRIGSGRKKYDPERYGPIAGTAWLDGIRLIER